MAVLARRLLTFCIAAALVPQTTAFEVRARSAGATAPQQGRGKRIRQFDREPLFPQLLRIRRSQAGKPGPHIVDNVEVAVRAVIVAKADVGADGLRVRRIHLDKRAGRQKARKGVVDLGTGQHD